MTLDELLKLLGITEKDAEATRLIDGVVPAVHFVDLGANGEGEGGFLVKKGRKDMKIGKLNRDENGNFDFVKKSAEDGDDPVKLSAGNKAALVALVETHKAKIGELETALSGAEEDEAATGMPDAIKTILGGMAKSFETEEAPAADDGATAEPSEKSADGDGDGDTTGPDPVPAADDTFTIGETVVTGNLAKYAAGLAQAAGEQLKDNEFAAGFEQQIAGMAALQAQLDPNSATNQAVAQVSKRMGDRFAKLEQENANMRAQIEALTAVGTLGGLMVPDGTPAAEPTKKNAKPAAPRIMPGQDIGRLDLDGDGYNFKA